MKRAAIIQPSFLPWRGYFAIIQAVDVFIFLDDVQYDRRGWRNRNKIKTPNGTQWISVPIDSKGRYDQLIMDTRICNETFWARKLLRTVELNYAKAPFFTSYFPWLSERLKNAGESLSELDIQTTLDICDFLNFKPEFKRSSELNLGPIDRTDRLVRLCKSVGATSYLSGPSAQGYIGEGEAFKKAGIELEFAHYEFEPYPQGHGAFVGEVSILDLLFHCGPQAGKYAQLPGYLKEDCGVAPDMLNAPHEAHTIA